MLAQRQLAFFSSLLLFCCTFPVHAASGLWLDVPYIHQEKDGCGSASLAMILRYWQAKDVPVASERTDPATIQRQLYAASPRGIYASDMQRYLRESGFEVFAFRGQWSDLRSNISKGRPLIVGLKPRSSPAHYVVIVGIGPHGTAVLVNDPQRGKLVQIYRSDFEKAWQGTDDWTLLAVPKLSE